MHKYKSIRTQISIIYVGVSPYPFATHFPLPQNHEHEREKKIIQIGLIYSIGSRNTFSSYREAAASGSLHLIFYHFKYNKISFENCRTNNINVKFILLNRIFVFRNYFFFIFLDHFRQKIDTNWRRNQFVGTTSVFFVCGPLWSLVFFAQF